MKDGGEGFAHDMRSLKSWKRRGQGEGKGDDEGLKLLRGIGKIFELPRRSNYELCETKPTLWRCARAFAHTGTPSSPQWEPRETRNFRGVLSSGCGRMDGWMADTVKKTLV